MTRIEKNKNKNTERKQQYHWFVKKKGRFQKQGCAQVLHSIIKIKEMLKVKKKS